MDEENTRISNNFSVQMEPSGALSFCDIFSSQSIESHKYEIACNWETFRFASSSGALVPPRMQIFSTGMGRDAHGLSWLTIDIQGQI